MKLKSYIYICTELYTKLHVWLAKKHDKTRQAETKQHKTRQDMARHDETGQHKIRQDDIS